jgi:ribosomal protein S18 acetylase RimI-like enzyme
VPAGEAVPRTELELDGLPPAPGVRLLAVYDGRLDVARLWLREHEHPDGRHVRLVDVAVHPDRRGRGYGRSVVTLAEARCRDEDAVSMEATVLGDEAAALGWFEGRGFEVTAQTLWKPLSTALSSPTARR